jgi:hypothetical protein
MTLSDFPHPYCSVFYPDFTHRLCFSSPSLLLMSKSLVTQFAIRVMLTFFIP